MLAVEIVCWACVGLIVRTHALYPLAAAALGLVLASPPCAAHVRALRRLLWMTW